MPNIFLAKAICTSNFRKITNDFEAFCIIQILSFFLIIYVGLRF